MRCDAGSSEDVPSARSSENMRLAGLVRMRFRGVLTRADTTLVSFAGKVDGQPCTDPVERRFRSAIETSFERVYQELGKLPGAQERKAPTATEI